MVFQGQCTTFLILWNPYYIRHWELRIWRSRPSTATFEVPLESPRPQDEGLLRAEPDLGPWAGWGADFRITRAGARAPVGREYTINQGLTRLDIVSVS